MDADHAGNRITRCSHTGIIIILNWAPIIWFSKAQSTIETSTFGAEFVATQIAVEMVKALCYKLYKQMIILAAPTTTGRDDREVTAPRPEGLGFIY